MTIKGSCHCGNTQFEASEAPHSVTRCTCSLCSKRGALWAYYKPAQFRLTTPTEKVATYLWGSRTVKHHFCANWHLSKSPDWWTDRESAACVKSPLDDFALRYVRLRHLFRVTGLVDRQA